MCSQSDAYRTRLVLYAKLASCSNAQTRTKLQSGSQPKAQRPYTALDLGGRWSAERCGRHIESLVTSIIQGDAYRARLVLWARVARFSGAWTRTKLQSGS